MVLKPNEIPYVFRGSSVYPRGLFPVGFSEKPQEEVIKEAFLLNARSISPMTLPEAKEWTNS